MFNPPYPPYDPTDPAGFSYDTVVRRWPVILTGVIDRLSRENHGLELQSQQLDADSSEAAALKSRISEGMSIIEKLSKLKYHMGRDHVMEPISEDREAYVKEYNLELATLAEDGRDTWFKAPWLYAECYLYRLLRSYFKTTIHWANVDPFFSQKQDMFQMSGASIYQIATTIFELDDAKATLQADPDKIGILFKEMIQMCLWGNATDLSLLTHLSAADIQHLQTVGTSEREARQKFILRDDQQEVWDHVKSLTSGRVDFVLDNAGFELFTDFVFADFLVTYTPHVSKVVFHPKLIPWFVSDVTPYDFSETIKSLLDPAFFAGSEVSVPNAKDHLAHMVTRWQQYLRDETFALSVPLDTLYGDPRATLAEFWTGPWPYWDLKERDQKLWTNLSESGLVIFKGDLNYRKLAGDIKWPASTPLATALGPLAGSFPILSLRTNKADVVVGVDQAVADKLDQSGESWRTSGRYALISFLPRNVEQ